MSRIEASTIVSINSDESLVSISPWFFFNLLLDKWTNSKGLAQVYEVILLETFGIKKLEID